MKISRIPPWIWLCVPVVVGALIMFACGAPMARWGGNLAGGVFGLATYFVVLALPRPNSQRAGRGRAALAFVAFFFVAFFFVAFFVVAATLVSPGMLGIRRWHMLGPVRIHPSALLTPALLVFAAGMLRRRPVSPVFAHVILLGLQAIHFLQPDAGQATALGLGAATLVLVDSRSRAKYAIAFVYVTSGALAWLRFDPLPSVAFVEDIVGPGFPLHPGAGAAALLSLSLLVAAPALVGAMNLASRSAALGLVAYFVGFGTSEIVGAFLGLAGIVVARTRSIPDHGSVVTNRD